MKKLTISRKDLKNNLKIIRTRLNSFGKDDSGNLPKIIAVVKGNGMGLGLVEYSKFLINNGIDFLAVANLEEALLLRQAGIDEEILMLTPFTKEKELAQLIENKITLTVSSKEQIEIIEKIAKIQDCEAKAHFKIDTGFGRFGFLYSNQNDILEAFKLCDNLKITGTYTHFAKPMEQKFTEKQFDRFLEVIKFLKQEGQTPRNVALFSIYIIFEISYDELKCDSNRFCVARKNFSESEWSCENWRVEIVDSRNKNTSKRI